MTWALWLVIGVVVVALLVILWQGWAAIEERAQEEERERMNRILQASLHDAGFKSRPEWPRSKGKP